MNGIFPELDCEIIRNQLAAGTVFIKYFSQFTLDVNGPKYIAACAMIKARDHAQYFALSAFAGTGCSEKQYGFIAVTHDMVYGGGLRRGLVFNDFRISPGQLMHVDAGGALE